MRTKMVLMETFNKIPRIESVVVNQLLLLEVLCDMRDMLDSRYIAKDIAVAPWKNLKHSSEPANEEKDDSTVAPFDDEPEQKILKPIDEPI